MITQVCRSLVLPLTLAALLAADPGGDRSAAQGSPGELDGFAIGRLPPGTGTRVSDFRTEWGGVAFASRVWERPTDRGHRVDAKVNVMRGQRLRDLPALRAFLSEYHEKDPAEWHPVPFEHPDGSGLRSAGFAFWLVRPHTAVSLRLDPERFGEADLTATALGIRERAAHTPARAAPG